MNDYLYQNYQAFNGQNVSPVQLYAAKKQIDISAEATRDEIHTANKLKIVNQRHQLNMQKEARKAELLEYYSTKRQLTTRSIAENSDGYIMMELIFPDGKRCYSEAICPERYFRAKYFYAADSVSEENVLNIVWQGEENGIFLSGKTMTAKAMDKAFLAKGIAFRIPRRVKKEMLEQILAFLTDGAEKIEVPRCVGWTKNSAGVWVFEKAEKNTLEGMINEK